LEVDYIKAGLFVTREDHAGKIARSLVRAVEGSDNKIILAGYADYETVGTISPTIILKVSTNCGVGGVMLDTFTKNGSSIFDHMTTEGLHYFVEGARKGGLTVALAGSIKMDHAQALKEIGPDIVGVRGAVCSGNDRRKGMVEIEKVQEFKKILE
jgi:uncharacterized protein (UPF0264 family)